MKKILIILLRLFFLSTLLVMLLFYAANPLIKRYDSNVRQYVKNRFSQDLNYQQVRLRGFPLPAIVVHGLSYKQGINFSLNISKATFYVNPLNLFWNQSHLIWSIKAAQPKIDIIKENKEEFHYDLESYDNDTLSFIFGTTPRFKNHSIEFTKEFIDLFSKNISLLNLDIFNGSIAIWNTTSEVQKIENINMHGSLDIEDSRIEFRKSHLSANYIAADNSKYSFGASTDLRLSLEYSNTIVSKYVGSFYYKAEDKKIFQTFSPVNLNIVFKVEHDLLFPLTASVDFSSNGNIKLQNIHAEITPFVSKDYPALYLELKGERDGPFTFLSILELRKDFRFWQSRLVKDSLSIFANQIEFAGDNLVRFQDVKINTTEDAVQLSGSTTLDLENYKITANASNFDLSKLDFLIDLPNLVFTGDMSLEYSPKQNISLSSKTFSFKNYKTANNNFSVSSGKIENFALKLKGTKPLSLYGNVDLDKVKVEYPKADFYNAKKITGTVNLKKTKTYTCESNLNFKGFSYKDANVSVNDVDLNLKNLTGKYSVKSGFSANAYLSANKLKLKSSYIDILGLDTIAGPLSVTVDSAGKYLVKSNASATNVKMNLSSKNISASGSVDFSLTSDNKSFLSSGIYGSINTKPFTLSDINFEVLEKSYYLKRALLKAFQGTTRISGELGRNTSIYNLSIDSEKISMPEFSYLLGRTKQEEFTGSLKKLKLDLSGLKGDNNSVTGHGELHFEKGRLKKLELDEILGSPVQGAKKDEGTYVDNLHINATINKGIIQTDDFILAGKFYTLKGSGQYSFDNGFKVKGNAVYLEKTLSELGGPIKILRRLIGSLIKVQVPVKIEGPAADPKVEADLSRVMSILSPGRAVQSIGEGFEDILGGIRDVVTGQ